MFEFQEYIYLSEHNNVELNTFVISHYLSFHFSVDCYNVEDGNYAKGFVYNYQTRQSNSFFMSINLP